MMKRTHSKLSVAAFLISLAFSLSAQHPNTASMEATNGGSSSPRESLTGFFAVCNGNHVMLEWNTVFEHGADSFIVERSADRISFETVLEWKSSGRVNALLVHYDEDNAPIPGISYYRLKQKNGTGTFNYSYIIPVYFDPAGTSLAQGQAVARNTSSHSGAMASRKIDPGSDQNLSAK